MSEQSARNSTIDRRRFLGMTLVGLSAPAVGSLASCSGGGGGGLGGGQAGGTVKQLVVPANVSAWLPAYKAVAARYEQESGVRVVIREFPHDGVRTQMINAIRSNSQTFDVFHLDEPYVAEFYANGWVTPLKQIDPSFNLDSAVLRYDNLPFWDATKKISSPDGDVLGLPINGNVDLLMYRKDLYDELGLSVPKTWQEVIANGQAAQRSGKVRFGYAPRSQFSPSGSIIYDWMHVFYSYGGNWFVDEGTDWTPAVNSAAAVQAVEVYRELARLGPPAPQTIGFAEAIATMQSGEALQSHLAAVAAPQLEDTAKSRVSGKFGYAVVPAGSSGKPTPVSGAFSLAVPAGLPKERAEAAYKFITWVLSKDAQQLFVQKGGIPTRSDIYTSADLPPAAKPYLKAIGDSMPYVRHHVRYPFAAAIVENSDRSISQLVAGTGPIKPALDRLEQAITSIVRDAGYLK